MLALFAIYAWPLFLIHFIIENVLGESNDNLTWRGIIVILILTPVWIAWLAFILPVSERGYNIFAEWIRNYISININICDIFRGCCGE
jgi:hypothetical protein